MPEIVALYADGGCIARNPSPLGGTWAFCQVDAAGQRLGGWGGVLPAPPGGTISNNLTEFVAAVLALESVPVGWTGTLYTDSNVTRGRLVDGWALNGLPQEWIKRGAAALQRHTHHGHLTFRAVLLQGHPTAADLRAGVGAKRGLPVSVHNCWCDHECQRQAARYRATREAA
jgi:ribonuclease HI